MSLRAATGETSGTDALSAVTAAGVPCVIEVSQSEVPSWHGWEGPGEAGASSSVHADLNWEVTGCEQLEGEATATPLHEGMTHVGAMVKMSTAAMSTGP